MSLHGKQRATVCRYASTIVRRRPGKQKRTTDEQKWRSSGSTAAPVMERCSRAKRSRASAQFPFATLLVLRASEVLLYFLACWMWTTFGPSPPHMLLEPILREEDP